jgi:O-acetyl-ADP-ribose deacetylase (regulator of RNase III)
MVNNLYNEVKGDLIALAKQGQFDVIGHGCNCLSVMGAGLAPQMADAFGCDSFPMELDGPDINKLGCIDYKEMDDCNLTVVNIYSQYSYGSNHKDGISIPFDYEAFTIALRKMNSIFKGRHIGLPKIGAGLAGGDWDTIKNIICKELKDCTVTVVIWAPKSIFL